MFEMLGGKPESASWRSCSESWDCSELSQSLGFCKQADSPVLGLVPPVLQRENEDSEGAHLCPQGGDFRRGSDEDHGAGPGEAGAGGAQCWHTGEGLRSHKRPVGMGWDSAGASALGQGVAGVSSSGLRQW